mmetsp:Transcript_33530/g.132231  ORF Transcript_33530/g.132231 Transcript_33530/m.132231 type:complete len:226 (-) Transcript_33530:116-793(-)
MSGAMYLLIENIEKDFVFRTLRIVSSLKYSLLSLGFFSSPCFSMYAFTCCGSLHRETTLTPRASARGSFKTTAFSNAVNFLLLAGLGESSTSSSSSSSSSSASSSISSMTTSDPELSAASSSTTSSSSSSKLPSSGSSFASFLSSIVSTSRANSTRMKLFFPSRLSLGNLDASCCITVLTVVASRSASVRISSKAPVSSSSETEPMTSSKPPQPPPPTPPEKLHK